ncbi:hypothetical protein RZR97_01880 [Hydrogenimonas thermophila]|uniref:hypothetical protein n=1 Tax=Hydrogenimonas thermophila TaxID=223786 RepID=UPI0029373BC2|nr:hypothetical protein [Hydrogenimonas thermophila]WOE70334.1 hypothetical protein RZR91_01890 [Hydrogenimonas thermophila]WOE72851.1 hypothetical protein RZR97_01880 [Hydrogenimonas thermophila]
MSKKDGLIERIRQIDGKLKFFRNTILAISSGLVWSVYAMIENKADEKIIILASIGLVVLVLIFIRTKSLEVKQNWLIEELEKEQ